MTRAQRLTAARLYLVTDATPGGRPLLEVLEPALAAGVDLFQLRAKTADDATILRAAAVARAACTAAGALFVVNDRPDLAVAARADGVHVGQDDDSVAAARAIVGPDVFVGLSTHSAAQVDAALATTGDARPDYIAVGPIHATPTKPGRPAVGLEPIRHAARVATLPWFAIGGIDEETVGEVVAAGAARIVVVRAIAEAADVAGVTRRLRAAVGPTPATFQAHGQAQS